MMIHTGPNIYTRLAESRPCALCVQSNDVSFYIRAKFVWDDATTTVAPTLMTQYTFGSNTFIGSTSLDDKPSVDTPWQASSTNTLVFGDATTCPDPFAIIAKPDMI